MRTVCWVLLTCFEIASGTSYSINALTRLMTTLTEKNQASCFTLLYPQRDYFQNGWLKLWKTREFRMLKVTSIGRNSEDRSCSTMTIWLAMGWEERSKVEYSQFVARVAEISDIWLIFLANGTDFQEFFADITFPFTSQVLTAEQLGDGWEIKKVWRVADGYPLRVVRYADGGINELLQFHRMYSAEKRDLEGMAIRASTKDDMPISGLERLPEGGWKISGFFGDVFYELVERLNATSELVHSVDNTTGSAEGGVWNGLIGMLVRNETDFAVGPMSMRFDLVSVVHHAWPLLRTNYQIYFKQDGVVTEWGMFFKPFGWRIWGLMASWLLVASFAMNYFYRVGMWIGNEHKLFSLEFTRGKLFFLFLQAYCQQGNNMVPKSWACRGLFITGYLMSTVLLTSYSAALISSLTVRLPARPFDSFPEFLTDNSYKLTAIANSTDYTYFSEATEPTLQAIYRKKMKAVPDEDLPHGKEEGLMKVCTEHNLALFITSAVTMITAGDFRTKMGCPVLNFRKPLGTVFITITMRKNWPYDRLINSELQIMAERGIIKRLHQRQWPLRTSNDEDVAKPEVEIRQVAQIHGVLVSGIALSLVILAFEVILQNRESYSVRYKEAWDSLLKIVIFGSFSAILIAIIFV